MTEDFYTDGRFGKQYLHLESTDSTNEVIKRLLQDGVTIESTPSGGRLIEGIPEEGSVVSTDYQSKGKGRRGRIWDGEKGMNLMFSMLLTPKVDPSRYSMVTLVAAMAVCSAIREMYKVDVEIKWPNDIIVEGKKLCGILTELVRHGDTDYAIVGIGVNVYQTNFDDELRGKATSLYEYADMTYSRTQLLKQILDNFEKYYDTFQSVGNMSLLKNEYNYYLAGKNASINVLDPQKPFSGVALGIDDEGQLLVEDMAGELHSVYAGEVSIGGIYGEQ